MWPESSRQMVRVAVAGADRADYPPVRPACLTLLRPLAQSSAWRAIVRAALAAIATTPMTIQNFEPRLRIILGPSIAIGPGKAALLEAIAETGSIAAAGRRLGMSYRRAWVLVKTMNACFREPLVEATKGGVQGGGAQLTAVGREVIAR